MDVLLLTERFNKLEFEHVTMADMQFLADRLTGNVVGLENAIMETLDRIENEVLKLEELMIDIQQTDIRGWIRKIGRATEEVHVTTDIDFDGDAAAAAAAAEKEEEDKNIDAK